MATRTFSPESQELFAALSGDFNPLHLDPLFARRVMIGRPVVHGIHLLLWALEACLPGPGRLARLTTAFKSPLAVGEPVTCRSEQTATGAVRILCESAGRMMLTAEFTLTPTNPPMPIPDALPRRLACQTMAATDLAGASGTLALALDRAALRRLLPRIADLLPGDQLAALLAATNLVGMHCPGLHSIFSDLDFTFAPPKTGKPAQLAWRVRRFDTRFSCASIDLSGPGLTGVLTAFRRPEPVAQPGVDDLAGRIAPDTWRGRRALVIGGSRGLGELCGKLLAAGGADLCLTYHRGKVDAERVVAEIVAGGRQARASAYDVLAPPADLAARLGAGWRPTHLYYFATPPIFVAGKGEPSADLLAAFRAYYVDGFVDTVKAVRRLTDAALTVFYPSSVAADSPPLDMREYAAAKQAGEAACRTLAAADSALTVYTERLPRTRTDQTATIVPVEAADPVSLLLSILSRC